MLYSCVRACLRVRVLACECVCLRVGGREGGLTFWVWVSDAGAEVVKTHHLCELRV